MVMNICLCVALYYKLYLQASSNLSSDYDSTFTLQMNWNTCPEPTSISIIRG